MTDILECNIKARNNKLSYGHLDLRVSIGLTFFEYNFVNNIF